MFTSEFVILLLTLVVSIFNSWVFTFKSLILFSWNVLFFFPLLFLLVAVSFFSLSFSLLLLLLWLLIFELLFKLFDVSYSSLLLWLFVFDVSLSFFQFSLEKTWFTRFKVLSIFCLRLSKFVKFKIPLFEDKDDGVLLVLLLSVILFICSLVLFISLFISLFSKYVSSSFSALDSVSEILSIFFNLEFTNNCWLSNICKKYSFWSTRVLLFLMEFSVPI